MKLNKTFANCKGHNLVLLRILRGARFSIIPWLLLHHSYQEECWENKTEQTSLTFSNKSEQEVKK